MMIETNYILAIAILCIIIIVLIGVCTFMFIMWRTTQKEIDNYHAPVTLPDVKWLPNLEEEDDEFRTEV